MKEGGEILKSKEGSCCKGEKRQRPNRKSEK